MKIKDNCCRVILLQMFYDNMESAWMVNIKGMPKYMLHMHGVWIDSWHYQYLTVLTSHL